MRLESREAALSVMPLRMMDARRRRVRLLSFSVVVMIFSMRPVVMEAVKAGG